MKTENNYRPAHLEFDVATDGTPIPENLGQFETAEEALMFVQKNLFGLNQAVTVNRFMDAFEKSEIRKKVNSILEDMMPTLEQDMRNRMNEFNEAKTAKENAIEMVSAYTNEAKTLAVEVKRGLVEIKLDELYTWKVPYKGRFYFFTFIDNSIRLVKIADMVESEKTELFSQGTLNESFFDNGEIATQKGKKK